MKTERFISLSENDKIVYSAGLMDGFYAMQIFGASEGTYQNLLDCTRDMDLTQIAAIITKYAKDDPEIWQYPVSIEAHNALNDACPGGLRLK